MKLRLLKIFIFVLIIYCVNAKRWGGGGSRSSGGSRSRPSSTSWGHSPSHTSSNRPSSTSYNSGRTSSSNFLHAESGRPSLPANYHTSYHPAPRPSVTHTPSAPSFPSSNTHNVGFGRPSSGVNERHQQSSSSVSHNNPYERQPAYNPHVNTGFGSHGTSSVTHSPPYPLNHPNHPLPSNIGSSSFPSNTGYHPVNPGSVYHAPTSPGFQPPTNAGYHPVSNGAVYHAPVNPGYHAQTNSPGLASYHPVSNGAVYHPPANAAYHPTGVYHPTVSGVYHPPTYSQPPSHTVYVVPDSRSSSSRPGIGTYIASGVAGGVAAGATNAIVDHAIRGIFHPNSHGVHTYPSAPAPGTPTTSITNNYYYNNGAPAPAPSSYNGLSSSSQPDQPAQSNSFNNEQPLQLNSTLNSPSTTNYQGSLGSDNGGRRNGVVSRTPEQPQEAHPDSDNAISDEELMKITEELFDNLKTNINQYVELNLQKRVAIIDGAVSDEASEPLFIVKPGLDSLQTVSKLKALYDNYKRNATEKEVVSFDRRSKENAFLDEIMKTAVMRKALNWLSEKHYVKANDDDKKELLRSIWFTIYGDTSSSFERVFLSETLPQNAGIAGMQNWIYFADQEAKKNVDYMGYIDMLSLSGKGALLKLNLKSEGITLQGSTIFIGTPPELEMALYTICMHTRYNGYCPVSLGGAKLFIITQAFKDNNNYLIDIAFPIL